MVFSARYFACSWIFNRSQVEVIRLVTFVFKLGEFSAGIQIHLNMSTPFYKGFLHCQSSGVAAFAPISSSLIDRLDKTKCPPKLCLQIGEGAGVVFQ